MRGTRKVRAGLALHARRVRYPEDDTALRQYAVVQPTRLPLQVRVERAGSKKILGIGSRRHQSATTKCDSGDGLAPKDVNYQGMSLLPTRIDLHHDRFLAKVIAPFDDLPAKFAVEPFG